MPILSKAVSLYPSLYSLYFQDLLHRDGDIASFMESSSFAVDPHAKVSGKTSPEATTRSSAKGCPQCADSKIFLNKKTKALAKPGRRANQPAFKTVWSVGLVVRIGRVRCTAAVGGHRSQTGRCCTRGATAYIHACLPACHRYRKVISFSKVSNNYMSIWLGNALFQVLTYPDSLLNTIKTSK